LKDVGTFLKSLLLHKPIGLLAWLTRRMPDERLGRLVFAFIKGLARRRPPRSSMRFLMRLDQDVRNLAGVEAVRLGDGVHPKHRHMRYHDFFTERLKPGERVLDIGCGMGALAYDLAALAGARVTAVEMEEANVRVARERFAHEAIRYILGVAPRDVPSEPFDTVVMSNVLEHIEDRIGFLRAVQARCRPARWLIRVPAYERDWLVPMKDEVGIDSRLDSTHFIEYADGCLEKEFGQAGLRVTELKRIWGEIWCEARPLAPNA
jgi:SAM-dependent methyltransferase